MNPMILHKSKFNKTCEQILEAIYLTVLLCKNINRREREIVQRGKNSASRNNMGLDV